MKETRKCAICGKEFITIVYNSKYCSDFCKEEGNRIKQREYHENLRKNKGTVKTEKKPEPLWKIDAKAREMGLSYGQYVVKMGL